MNETINNDEVVDLTEGVAMESNGSGKLVCFVTGVVVGVVVPAVCKKTIKWFKTRKETKKHIDEVISDALEDDGVKN